MLYRVDRTEGVILEIGRELGKLTGVHEPSASEAKRTGSIIILSSGFSETPPYAALLSNIAKSVQEKTVILELEELIGSNIYLVNKSDVRPNLLYQFSVLSNESKVKFFSLCGQTNEKPDLFQEATIKLCSDILKNEIK